MDPLQSWKAALKAGQTPDGRKLVKQYTADSIKRSEDGKTYTWTISTGAIDRDRDRIAVEGWHVDAFLKAGGPVLWAHQSQELPIGRAVWVKASGGALKARVEFAPEEINPMGERVRRLVDFGALKAASVGFRPLPGKAAWNDERNGIDFLETELLEFSIVPVPSNPEAVMDAKAAGDLGLLRAWALDTLGATAPPQFPAVEKALELAFLLKAGRTLSAENEARLRTARSYGDDVCAAGGDLCKTLDEVLAQVRAEPEPEPEPEPAKAPARPAQVLRLIPAPVRLPINRSEVVSAVRTAVNDAVAAAVRRATGRLD